MIEGGGLGVFRPEEIGPTSTCRCRTASSTCAVADEAEAVARRQAVPVVLPGPARRRGTAPTSACCAASIPENRLRVYDVRAVIETLADTGSVLELRRDFGLGMVTALVRIEGRPLGVVANNPTHLGGRDRQRRRRQGRPLPAAVRRLRPAGRCPCATRPASWSARRPRRPRWSATAAALFVIGGQPDRAVLHDRPAQGLRARAPRPWPAAASRRRSSRWRGRPASSAAWASRAR